MMRDIVRRIRESRNLNQANFAALINKSPSTVYRWENGERSPTGHEEIGALLRVAEPEEQRALLEALGIEDVGAFAADLLASAGVQLVERP
jgi:transcriptional regulator with XRE-family HTH domain